MSSLYDSLAGGARRSTSSSSRGGYSFHRDEEPSRGSSSKFRARGSTYERQGSAGQRKRNKTPVRRTRGRDDYLVDLDDREYAYRPPRREESSSWRPPELTEVISDLLLRVLEVAIGAIAHEIAMFFQYRRFGKPMYDGWDHPRR